MAGKKTPLELVKYGSRLLVSKLIPTYKAFFNLLMVIMFLALAGVTTSIYSVLCAFGALFFYNEWISEVPICLWRRKKS